MVPRAERGEEQPEAGKWSESGFKTRLGFAVLSALLSASTPAWAQVTPGTTTIVMTLIVAASGALALAGGLWAMAEHRNHLLAKRALKRTRAQARALLSTRDAWLSASRESLIVWNAETSEPLSYASGAKLMEDCLTGPDATMLSVALDTLAANGTPFSLNCRTNDGRSIAARGRPEIGRAHV